MWPLMTVIRPHTSRTINFTTQQPSVSLDGNFKPDNLVYLPFPPSSFSSYDWQVLV